MRCNIITSFFILLAAVKITASRTVCVNKFGSDDVGCSNGTSCCASLSALVEELASNCSAVSEAANKLVIHVKSDIQLNEALHLNNDCSDSQGLEVVGSINPRPTISCDTPDAGLYFKHVKNLTVTHLNFSNCGFQQEQISQNRSNSIPTFYSTLILLHCKHVVISNVAVRNSSGTGAVLYNTHGQVNIVNSTFESSNVREPPGGYQGGGGLHVELDFVPDDSVRNQVVWDYIIQGCYFLRNNASLHLTSKVPFISPIDPPHGTGRGGGLSVSVRGNTSHNRLKVSDCTFSENSAAFGGGLFILFDESPFNNTITVDSSKFVKNNCERAGGGASVGYAFFKDSEHHSGVVSTASSNSITFRHCLFEDNVSTQYGGGLHIFSTQAANLSILTNTMHIHNCTWKRNMAFIASALMLAPDIHDKLTKGLLPKVVLSNCTFLSNCVGNKTLVKNSAFNSSLNGLAAVFISDFQIQLMGIILFVKNSGTALRLTSASVKISNQASLNFTGNFGLYGGAIGVFGSSVMYIHDHTRLYFIKNTAKFRGGAICVESTDFLYEYLFSQNCFIKYQGNHSLPERDIVLYFDGNEAYSGNGHVLFLATLCPCFKDTDNHNHNEGSSLRLLNCVGNIAGPQTETNTSNIVKTLPRNFSLTLPHSKNVLEIQPGIRFKVNISATDELFQPTKVAYQASVQDTYGPDNISVDPAYMYVSNNTILLHGSSSSGTIAFEKGTASLQMSVILVDCPPGFVNDGAGSCLCGASHYIGVSGCVSSRSQIVQGFWAGRCDDNQLCTAYCPAGFCTYGDHVSSELLLLPSHINELDSFVCGPFRTGVLCGKCSDGFSTHYHSYFYGCKSNRLCNLGIVFFTISELLPLTIIYTFIMVFNISFTSGAINGFIFFAQIADSLSISASDTIRFPKVIGYFTQFHQFIYRMFNFDFFSVESLSFCLWEDATALDAMVMKYVTIIYALGLILVTVLLLKSSKVKKFCVCLRPRALRSAVIHGLTTFIIICYSQCARVTFQVITPAYLYGAGPKHIDTVVQRSGELKPFDQTHRKYAIPALFFFFILVVLPLLWLLLYPLLFKWMGKCKLSESKLATFLSKLFPIELLDSFQSCFKPNRRYFAGLYFLYRIMTLLFYTVSGTLVQFYSLLTLGMIVVITLHSIAQPYKNPWHNILDALIFANIMTVNALTLYNFQILSVGNEQSSHLIIVSLIVQLILMYLPLVCIVILVVRKIYSRVKRIIRRCSEEGTMTSEDSITLPSLRDSLIDY